MPEDNTVHKLQVFEYKAPTIVRLDVIRAEK
jgi:hypothetical protein